jgi:hypothetical protein
MGFKETAQCKYFVSRPALFLASTTFLKQTKVTLEKATELALGGSVLHFFLSYSAQEYISLQLCGFDVAIWLKIVLEVPKKPQKRCSPFTGPFFAFP